LAENYSGTGEIYVTSSSARSAVAKGRVTFSPQILASIGTSPNASCGRVVRWRHVGRHKVFDWMARMYDLQPLGLPENNDAFLYPGPRSVSSVPTSPRNLGELWWRRET